MSKKKSNLTGKPISTASMNLAIYGQMDPDMPSNEALKEVHQMTKSIMDKRLKDKDVKLVFFSTAGHTQFNQMNFYDKDK